MSSCERFQSLSSNAIHIQHQYVDGLVHRALGDDVLNPSLIDIGGPAVLEDGAGGVEVLGAVDTVTPVEEEVASLVCHRCEDGQRST